MGEGLDSNAVIGVVAAGWHPGEVFSISVIPKDGTAKCGWMLFIYMYNIASIRYKLCFYNYDVPCIIYVCTYAKPVAKSDCAQRL